jgi:hypothetical protein
MTRLTDCRLLLAPLVLAGALTACGGGGSQVTSPPPANPTPTLNTPPPPATPLPPSITDTPQVCYTMAELETMGVERATELAEFCFHAEDGSLTVIPQAQAIDTIHTTLGDPSRQVVFQGMSLAPNSPNGDLRTAVFRDGRGSDYYVALVANKLVEWTPPTDGPSLGNGALPEAELRMRAEALVTRGLPSFPDLEPRLQDLSGAKGDFHFFRWEGSDCASWTGMPPLAQVGITSSGEVFSYINTLFYCQ